MQDAKDPIEALEALANGEAVAVGTEETVPEWVTDPRSRDIEQGQIMVTIHLDATTNEIRMWTNFFNHEMTREILKSALEHAFEEHYGPDE